MDYIKQTRIEHVVGFCPHNGDYSYERKGRSYLVLDGVVLEKGEAPCDLSLRGTYRYVWYGSGRFELYREHILVKEIGGNTNLLNEQTLYIGTHSLDLETFQTYYNYASPIDERPILSESIPYMLYVEDDVIIAYDNLRTKEIRRIDNSTEVLWQFPLSSLGYLESNPGEIDKVDKILGVAYGKIWFYTDFWKLIALDLENGELIYSLDCFGVNWDRRTGNIFAIASNIMIIINTEKVAIIEQYNFLESDPEGIGAYRSIRSPLLQGGYFTFLGEKEGEYSGLRRVGIFDLKARKLVWECEVISKEEYLATGNHLVAPQPLYMSGSRLYIKDFQDTLHIFERVNE